MAERKSPIESNIEDVKGVIKRKGNNPNGSPLLGDKGLIVEPGDNAKYMRVNMVLFSMEKIDLNDIEAVNERLKEFFQLFADYDMKPTVAGMGLALNGMDRRRLWEIKSDTPSSTKTINNLPPKVKDSIKKAYKMMENLWEIYMNSGKINPVSGIFLGKNNFGYLDKTEYVLTPNQQNDSEYSADDIRKRYLTDSDNSGDK